MNTSANFDIDLMLDSQRYGVDFVKQTNKLRELEAIHWSDISQCWVVTRYQDVWDGFQGKYPLINSGRNEFSLISIPREERLDRIPNISKYVPHWVVSIDGPEHTRIRRLLMQALTKKIIEKIRPLARARVEELLDMAEKAGAVEFNEDVARALPGYVLFKLAGIPEQHFPALRDWANAMVEGMTASAPPPEALEKTDWCMGEMNKVVLEELEKRKTNPQDDLLTTLLHAMEGDDGLTLDEVLGTMHVVIVAGHDTTSNTMTMGLEALGRHPDAWQYMYENPDKMLDCVNELMRYIAMSGGQPRLAEEDFEWHGKQIKKGDIVFLSIQAANRDPDVWSDPEKLDFTRDTSNSVVFAPGVHHCVGHLLAKMQLCEFFSALVNRFESVDILDDPLDFMPTGIFRGLYSMNVKFNPRKK